MMKTFRLGLAEIRQLCRILYVDFTCFGYPFPPECTGTAQHQGT